MYSEVAWRLPFVWHVTISKWANVHIPQQVNVQKLKFNVLYSWPSTDSDQTKQWQMDSHQRQVAFLQMYSYSAVQKINVFGFQKIWTSANENILNFPPFTTSAFTIERLATTLCHI